MQSNIILTAFCTLPLAFGLLLYLFFRRYRLHLKPSHRMLRLVVGNTLVFLWVLSILVLAGEVRYRFFYDTTDSFGLTMTTQRWFQRHYKKNGQGFRDSIDYELRKPAGKRRITFLGDSFTAGHGIANVEDRFVNRIRSKNNEWEVHALSDCGWDTGKTLSVLQATRKFNYDLDIVVLVYCLNDVADIVPEWRATANRLVAENRTTGFLVNHSYLFNTFYYRYQASKEPDIANYYHFVLANYSGSVWETQKRRLAEIQQEVRSRNGRLMVVTFPFLHALGKDYEYRDVHAKLEHFWAAQGVPHLDLLRTYESVSPKKLTVNSLDPHPNELANELAANAIWEFIKEQTAK